MAREWGLSAREGELLPLLVMGMSATEVGSRLFIAPQTVKTHRYRIYRKAGVGTHAELVELVSQSHRVIRGLAIARNLPGVSLL